MKKYLIALSAFTVLTISVNAQQQRNTAGDAPMAKHQGKDHEKMRHGNHEKGMMMKQLNLSDAQKQQAKAIHKDYENQIRQLKADGNVNPNDFNRKKADLEKEQKAKFESVLTLDQKNKMQQLRKDQSAKREMMQQKRMDKMKAKLNLSDDQVSKLKSQQEDFKSQAKQIRENTSLTPDQKKQQIMELKKKENDGQKSILTTEQFQKKEELRNSRMKDMKNKRTQKS